VEEEESIVDLEIRGGAFHQGVEPLAAHPTTTLVRNGKVEGRPKLRREYSYLPRRHEGPVWRLQSATDER
jgi:hypothetical protein